MFFPTNLLDKMEHFRIVILVYHENRQKQKKEIE